MEKPRGKDAVIKAIIEAAIPLIAERGVTNVSFRDIARAANVNHGLITHYFGNKEELMRKVALDLGNSMFQAMQSRGDNLRTLWERVFAENSIQIRAIVRILLDTSIDRESFASLTFINEILQWFHSEQNKLRLNPNFDPDVLMFMTASLLVGSEVVGPHLKEVLHLDDEAFNKLKPKAFLAMLQEFQEPSPSAK
jgi:AcrR family transcriptional regulator